MVQLIPQESLADMLGSQLGQGLGQGLQQSLGHAVESYHKEKELKSTEQNLIDRGYPAQLARLAAVATKGGQTEILKNLLEQGMRQGQIGGFPQQQMQQPEEEQDEVQKVISEGNAGLTPKETVAVGKERFKTGLPVYQEAGTKLRGLQREKERLDILNNLNKSGKLPKNLGRINIDKEGNLRFAFTASPESQRYVKTLNEFSSNAKDTFGSRVTNFDLQQFMMRYPTLLNSEEGRKQISKQMEIVNKINSTYYRNLKKVFDRAGGVRKIDADIAEGLAEKMSEDEITKLVPQFEEISQNLISSQGKESLEEIFK